MWSLGSVLVLVLIISLVLMNKWVCVFNLRMLSLPAFWYWSYLAIIFVPSLVVAATERGTHQAMYLFGTTSVLITVPIGVILSTEVSKFRARETLDYYKRPLSTTVACTSTGTLLSALFISVCLAYSHVRQLEAVPLVSLLQNAGVRELSLQREDALKLLDSPMAYIYWLLEMVVFPYLTMLTLAIYLHTRRRFVLFAMTLALSVAYCSLTTQRTPVFMLALLCLFVYYLFQRGTISMSAIVRILFTAAISLLFPVLVVWLPSRSATLTDAAGAILERIFIGPGRVVFYYFELIPDVFPYQHGATIGKLAWLMGVPQSNILNDISNYIDPTLASGTANTAFIGMLHADFGTAGVLIGGVLAGVIMQGAQVFLVRRTKNIVNLCVFAFLFVKFSWLNMEGMPPVLLSEGVLFALLLAGLLTHREGSRAASIRLQRARGDMASEATWHPGG